jgi:hypothetical protein
VKRCDALRWRWRKKKKGGKLRRGMTLSGGDGEKRKRGGNLLKGVLRHLEMENFRETSAVVEWTSKIN